MGKISSPIHPGYGSIPQIAAVSGVNGDKIYKNKRKREKYGLNLKTLLSPVDEGGESNINTALDGTFRKGLGSDTDSEPEDEKIARLQKKFDLDTIFAESDAIEETMKKRRIAEEEKREKEERRRRAKEERIRKREEKIQKKMIEKEMRRAAKEAERAEEEAKRLRSAEDDTSGFSLGGIFSGFKKTDDIQQQSSFNTISKSPNRGVAPGLEENRSLSPNTLNKANPLLPLRAGSPFKPDDANLYKINRLSQTSAISAISTVTAESMWTDYSSRVGAHEDKSGPSYEDRSYYFHTNPKELVKNLFEVRQNEKLERYKKMREYSEEVRLEKPDVRIPIDYQAKAEAAMSVYEEFLRGEDERSGQGGQPMMLLSASERGSTPTSGAVSSLTASPVRGVGNLPSIGASDSQPTSPSKSIQNDLSPMKGPGSDLSPLKSAGDLSPIKSPHRTPTHLAYTKNVIQEFPSGTVSRGGVKGNTSVKYGINQSFPGKIRLGTSSDPIGAKLSLPLNSGFGELTPINRGNQLKNLKEKMAQKKFRGSAGTRTGTPSEDTDSLSLPPIDSNPNSTSNSVSNTPGVTPTQASKNHSRYSAPSSLISPSRNAARIETGGGYAPSSPESKAALLGYRQAINHNLTQDIMGDSSERGAKSSGMGGISGGLHVNYTTDEGLPAITRDGKKVEDVIQKIVDESRRDYVEKRRKEEVKLQDERKIIMECDEETQRKYVEMGGRLYGDIGKKTRREIKKMERKKKKEEEKLLKKKEKGEKEGETAPENLKEDGEKEVEISSEQDDSDTEIEPDIMEYLSQEVSGVKIIPELSPRYAKEIGSGRRYKWKLAEDNAKKEELEKQLEIERRAKARKWRVWTETEEEKTARRDKSKKEKEEQENAMLSPNARNSFFEGKDDYVNLQKKISKRLIENAKIDRENRLAGIADDVGKVENSEHEKGMLEWENIFREKVKGEIKEKQSDRKTGEILGIKGNTSVFNVKEIADQIALVSLFLDRNDGFMTDMEKIAENEMLKEKDRELRMKAAYKSKWGLSADISTVNLTPKTRAPNEDELYRDRDIKAGEKELEKRGLMKLSPAEVARREARAAVERGDKLVGGRGIAGTEFHGPLNISENKRKEIEGEDKDFRENINNLIDIGDGSPIKMLGSMEEEKAILERKKKDFDERVKIKQQSFAIRRERAKELFKQELTSRPPEDRALPPLSCLSPSRLAEMCLIGEDGMSPSPLRKRKELQKSADKINAKLNARAYIRDVKMKARKIVRNTLKMKEEKEFIRNMERLEGARDGLELEKVVPDTKKLHPDEWDDTEVAEINGNAAAIPNHNAAGNHYKPTEYIDLHDLKKSLLPEGHGSLSNSASSIEHGNGGNTNNQAVYAGGFGVYTGTGTVSKADQTHTSGPSGAGPLHTNTISSHLTQGGNATNITESEFSQSAYSPGGGKFRETTESGCGPSPAPLAIEDKTYLNGINPADETAFAVRQAQGEFQSDSLLDDLSNPRPKNVKHRHYPLHSKEIDGGKFENYPNNYFHKDKVTTQTTANLSIGNNGHIRDIGIPVEYSAYSNERDNRTPSLYPGEGGKSPIYQRHIGHNLGHLGKRSKSPTAGELQGDSKHVIERRSKSPRVGDGQKLGPGSGPIVRSRSGNRSPTTPKEWQSIEHLSSPKPWRPWIPSVQNLPNGLINLPSSPDNVGNKRKLPPANGDKPDIRNLPKTMRIDISPGKPLDPALDPRYNNYIRSISPFAVGGGQNVNPQSGTGKKVNTGTGPGRSSKSPTANRYHSVSPHSVGSKGSVQSQLSDEIQAEADRLNAITELRRKVEILQSHIHWMQQEPDGYSGVRTEIDKEAERLAEEEIRKDKESHARAMLNAIHQGVQDGYRIGEDMILAEAIENQIQPVHRRVRQARPERPKTTGAVGGGFRGERYTGGEKEKEYGKRGVGLGTGSTNPTAPYEIKTKVNMMNIQSKSMNTSPYRTNYYGSEDNTPRKAGIVTGVSPSVGSPQYSKKNAGFAPDPLSIPDTITRGRTLVRELKNDFKYNASGNYYNYQGDELDLQNYDYPKGYSSAVAASVSVLLGEYDYANGTNLNDVFQSDIGNSSSRNAAASVSPARTRFHTPPNYEYKRNQFLSLPPGELKEVYILDPSTSQYVKHSMSPSNSCQRSVVHFSPDTSPGRLGRKGKKSLTGRSPLRSYPDKQNATSQSSVSPSRAPPGSIEKQDSEQLPRWSSVTGEKRITSPSRFPDPEHGPRPAQGYPFWRPPSARRLSKNELLSAPFPARRQIVHTAARNQWHYFNPNSEISIDRQEGEEHYQDAIGGVPILPLPGMENLRLIPPHVMTKSHKASLAKKYRRTMDVGDLYDKVRDAYLEKQYRMVRDENQTDDDTGTADGVEDNEYNNDLVNKHLSKLPKQFLEGFGLTKEEERKVKRVVGVYLKESAKMKGVGARVLLRLQQKDDEKRVEKSCVNELKEKGFNQLRAPGAFVTSKDNLEKDVNALEDAKIIPTVPGSKTDIRSPRTRSRDGSRPGSPSGPPPNVVLAGQSGSGRVSAIQMEDVLLSSKASQSATDHLGNSIEGGGYSVKGGKSSRKLQVISPGLVSTIDGAQQGSQSEGSDVHLDDTNIDIVTGLRKKVGNWVKLDMDQATRIALGIMREAEALADITQRNLENAVVTAEYVNRNIEEKRKQEQYDEKIKRLQKEKEKRKMKKLMYLALEEGDVLIAEDWKEIFKFQKYRDKLRGKEVDKKMKENHGLIGGISGYAKDREIKVRELVKKMQENRIEQGKIVNVQDPIEQEVLMKAAEKFILKNQIDDISFKIKLDETINKELYPINESSDVVDMQEKMKQELQAQLQEKENEIRKLRSHTVVIDKKGNVDTSKIRNIFDYDFVELKRKRDRLKKKKEKARKGGRSPRSRGSITSGTTTSSQLNERAITIANANRNSGQGTGSSVSRVETKSSSTSKKDSTTSNDTSMVSVTTKTVTSKSTSTSKPSSSSDSKSKTMSSSSAVSKTGSSSAVSETGSASSSSATGDARTSTEDAGTLKIVSSIATSGVGATTEARSSTTESRSQASGINNNIPKDFKLDAFGQIVPIKKLEDQDIYFPEVLEKPVVLDGPQFEELNKSSSSSSSSSSINKDDKSQEDDTGDTQSDTVTKSLAHTDSKTTLISKVDSKASIGTKDASEGAIKTKESVATVSKKNSSSSAATEQTKKTSVMTATTEKTAKSSVSAATEKTQKTDKTVSDDESEAKRSEEAEESDSDEEKAEESDSDEGSEEKSKRASTKKSSVVSGETEKTEKTEKSSSASGSESDAAATDDAEGRSKRSSGKTSTKKSSMTSAATVTEKTKKSSMSSATTENTEKTKKSSSSSPTEKSKKTSMSSATTKKTDGTSTKKSESATGSATDSESSEEDESSSTKKSQSRRESSSSSSSSATGADSSSTAANLKTTTSSATHARTKDEISDSDDDSSGSDGTADSLSDISSVSEVSTVVRIEFSDLDTDSDDDGQDKGRDTDGVLATKRFRKSKAEVLASAMKKSPEDKEADRIAEVLARNTPRDAEGNLLFEEGSEPHLDFVVSQILKEKHEEYLRNRVEYLKGSKKLVEGRGERQVGGDRVTEKSWNSGSKAPVLKPEKNANVGSRVISTPGAGYKTTNTDISTGISGGASPKHGVTMDQVISFGTKIEPIDSIVTRHQEVINNLKKKYVTVVKPGEPKLTVNFGFGVQDSGINIASRSDLKSLTRMRSPVGEVKKTQVLVEEKKDTTPGGSNSRLGLAKKREEMMSKLNISKAKSQKKTTTFDKAFAKSRAIGGETAASKARAAAISAESASRGGSPIDNRPLTYADVIDGLSYSKEGRITPSAGGRSSPRTPPDQPGRPDSPLNRSKNDKNHGKVQYQVERTPLSPNPGAKKSSVSETGAKSPDLIEKVSPKRALIMRKRAERERTIAVGYDKSRFRTSPVPVLALNKNTTTAGGPGSIDGTRDAAVSPLNLSFTDLDQVDQALLASFAKDGSNTSDIDRTLLSALPSDSLRSGSPRTGSPQPGKVSPKPRSPTPIVNLSLDKFIDNRFDVNTGRPKTPEAAAILEKETLSPAAEEADKLLSSKLKEIDDTYRSKDVVLLKTLVGAESSLGGPGPNRIPIITQATAKGDSSDGPTTLIGGKVPLIKNTTNINRSVSPNVRAFKNIGGAPSTHDSSLYTHPPPEPKSENASPDGSPSASPRNSTKMGTTTDKKKKKSFMVGTGRNSRSLSKDMSTSTAVIANTDILLDELPIPGASGRNSIMKYNRKGATPRTGGGGRHSLEGEHKSRDLERQAEEVIDDTTGRNRRSRLSSYSNIKKPSVPRVGELEVEYEGRFISRKDQIRRAKEERQQRIAERNREREEKMMEEYRAWRELHNLNKVDMNVYEQREVDFEWNKFIEYEKARKKKEKEDRAIRRKEREEKVKELVERGEEVPENLKMENNMSDYSEEGDSEEGGSGSDGLSDIDYLEDDNETIRLPGVNMSPVPESLTGTYKDKFQIMEDEEKSEVTFREHKGSDSENDGRKFLNAEGRHKGIRRDSDFDKFDNSKYDPRIKENLGKVGPAQSKRYQNKNRHYKVPEVTVVPNKVPVGSNAIAYADGPAPKKMAFGKPDDNKYKIGRLSLGSNSDSVPKTSNENPGNNGNSANAGSSNPVHTNPDLNKTSIRSPGRDSLEKTQSFLVTDMVPRSARKRSVEEEGVSPRSSVVSPRNSQISPRNSQVEKKDSKQSWH